MSDVMVVKAQKVMLEILTEVDRICKKYNLIYWLDYGTLLGAVRHKGFIPWDDDLDITMPREDYERFLEVVVDELPKRYFFQSQKTDKYYQNFFSKIRDRRSTFIDAWEEKRDIKYHQGIYIDIFPANFIKKSPITVTALKSFVLISKFLHNRHIKLIQPTKYLIKLINFFHNKEGEYIVSGGECMHYVTLARKEDFFPLTLIEFEEKKFPIPKKTDKYLTSIFGEDYMQLPSKDKQKVHSVYISITQPCRYEKELFGKNH